MASDRLTRREIYENSNNQRTPMNQYDEAVEDVIFLYNRCQWQKRNNTDQPGSCFRDDREIYLIWDSASANEERCFHVIEWMQLFARDHKNYDLELEAWCQEVMAREPVQIRTKSDRWKKNNRNNTQVWKLLMQFQEEVLRRLEQDEDKSNTFSEHFEFTQA
jgi:hypothetical protein